MYLQKSLMMHPLAAWGLSWSTALREFPTLEPAYLKGLHCQVGRKCRSPSRETLNKAMGEPIEGETQLQRWAAAQHKLQSASPVGEEPRNPQSRQPASPCRPSRNLAGTHRGRRRLASPIFSYPLFHVQGLWVNPGFRKKSPDRSGGIKHSTTGIDCQPCCR